MKNLWVTLVCALGCRSDSIDTDTSSSPLDPTEWEGPTTEGTSTTEPWISLDSIELQLELGLKRFRFTWSEVSGADWMQVVETPSPGVAPIVHELDATATQLELDVSLHRRWQATYVLEACSAALGCVAAEPLDMVDQDLRPAIGYLKYEGSQTDFTEFGYGLALDAAGDTLAVGTNVVGPEGYVGSVVVYQLGADGWSVDVELKPSKAVRQFGGFGHEISLSDDGETMLVGDGRYHHADCRVYVYQQQSTGWAPVATFFGNEATGEDAKSYGDLVALSGDGGTAVVAQNVHAIGFDYGLLDVFAVDEAGEWVFRQRLMDEPVDGWSPESISVSQDGSRIVVGQWYYGDRADYAVDTWDRGADGVWTLSPTWRLDAANTDQGFVSMSADGSLLATIVDEVPRLYRAGRSSWEEEDVFEQLSGRFLRPSLSRDGATLVVADPVDASSYSGVGDDSNLDSGSPSSGAVYVYGLSGSTWSLDAYVKASNPDPSDVFGYRVASSADGSVLAVTAPNEASAGHGFGADPTDNSAFFSGAVYLY
ncbi:MAG: hypothetical protein KTR31_21150 [Myxococcales bacterium]|nr:hypothetical protein [Myxococcales bacterium]